MPAAVAFLDGTLAIVNILYVDESGDTGALAAGDQKSQPLLVVGSLCVPQLEPLNNSSSAARSASSGLKNRLGEAGHQILRGSNCGSNR
jgi:hypothetical protein